MKESEEDTKGWQVRYTYGQFRTALSVARKLRSEGKRAHAEQLASGNSVVLVPPGEHDRHEALAKKAKRC